MKHIFTSDLQRAYQTAEAIAEAQSPSSDDASSEDQASSKVCRLSELREKDYGSSEGKKYGMKTGNLDQSDSETHDAMRIRVDRFLDSHLIPIVDKHVSDHIAIAIAAHGIILGVVLKALFERFPPRPSLSTPQSGSREGPPVFAAWSNTGVLQAKLELGVPMTESGKGPVVSHEEAHLTIELTNNLDHLAGLKKTRGGIGSSEFDSRQRTMDSFFNSASKKRKREETKDS